MINAVAASPFDACGTVDAEMAKIEFDMAYLAELSPSPELGKLLAEFRELRSGGCERAQELVYDRDAQRKLIRTFCSYKRGVEFAEKGSTQGFSNWIANCGR